MTKTKEENRTRIEKTHYNSLLSRWINYEDQITEWRKLEHKEKTHREGRKSNPKMEDWE